jgi:formylglycine-generating enzyme required for sulfatase activity
MVLIPAGTFEMGSNNGRSDEKPVHTVSVKSFLMSKYETTVGQFKAFVNDSGYSGSKVGKEWRCKGFMQPEFSQTERDPVVCVTWLDAVAYAEWLSKKTGKNYRLPTEAEWEYAARAGSTTKWHFGNDESRLREYAWYDGNSGSKTHEVGQKKPNDFGLYDMAGNVWEWTCSEKAAYSEGKQTQCNQSVSGWRVLRGGSWDFGARYVRSAYRGFNGISYVATNPHVDVGFRLITP